MKLSTRFTWIAFSTALLSAAALVVTLLAADFAYRKSLWQAQSEATFAANASWPSILHYRIAPAAEREFKLYRGQHTEVAWIAAKHVDGEVIASEPPLGDQNPDALLERSAASRLEVLHSTVEDGTLAATSYRGALAGLPYMDRMFLLSVPILSPLDPLRSDVSLDAYRLAQSKYDGVGARYVVGYLEQGIYLGDIVLSVATSSGKILGIALLILLLVFAFARSHARAISKPLVKMAEVAQAISAEEVPAKIKLPKRRNDEMAEITRVLNSVIDGLQRMRTKMEVDRSLMNLRADSSARKLDKATAEVDRTRHQIHRVSYFDPVTGLANRRLMLEHMSLLIQIASRERRHLGLVLLDISSIRRVHEAMGRESSDEVLRQLASRVIETVRESDLISHEPMAQDIARLDSDEFCVVMHGIHESEGAMTAAKRLVDVIQEPLTVNGESIRIETFAGVAIAPIHARSPEGLVRAADVALNAARERKNGYPALFDNEMDERGSERFQLEVDLRNANYDKEFYLLYQPQVNPDNGALLGVEALLRWRHPSRGNVPPFKFIPIAEQSGQIEAVGNWVVRRACADLQKLKSEGKAPPRVSVNMSSAQLGDAFVRVVRNAIDEYQVAPGELGLEITEGILVESVESVIEDLSTLHNDVGVHLSVDDFGTGYSSLSYLSKFPIDELKVDRSFVMAMEHDANAHQLTGAIIAIGQQLGLTVIVEGVENLKQLNLIKALGPVGIQGFYFSEPLGLEDLASFVVAASDSEQQPKNN
ncbi:MAG: EAL domain-containing protein [Cellvibrionales bacterium]|jgi:diguanylate cyclase (GGDEF)-like protein